MNFTQEQVLQMAPDDASKKAGQQLASASKWVAKNVNEKALWGDCQGSGKNPYKTMVDLGNLAFKCSCPSRKFPCKHGLGLMLLFVNQPATFSSQTNLDPAVSDWIDKRANKAEAKEEKEAKPVDEKAQQKRIETREKKISAGIEELNVWLKDTIRTGIMNVPKDIYNFNTNITARMVDAQATGLANQLRSIQQINFYEDGWQKQLTKKLATIYFLANVYQSNNMDAEWIEELNTHIGWTKSKDEVLAQEEIHDHWIVLSKTTEEENNLISDKTWLLGKQTNQFGLLLNFYPKNQLPELIHTVGSTIDAVCNFYPSIVPMRLLIKKQHSVNIMHQRIEGMQQLDLVLENIANTLATHPFIQEIPVLLSNLLIVQQAEQWFVKDLDNCGLSLRNTTKENWLIMSISKGKAISCFAIYTDGGLTIHSIWNDRKIYKIR
jgi:SWIM zinc finger